MPVEEHGKEWSRCWDTCTVQAYRTGWRGAWDAFKAALFRRDRLQVAQDVTLSLYVKIPADSIDVYAQQLEHNDGTS